MAREICKLNMTVVDNGDNTVAEGGIEFHGNWYDTASVLAHIFDALEIEPHETLELTVEAVRIMRDHEEVEE